MTKTPAYSTIHNQFSINGEAISTKAEIIELADYWIKNGKTYEQEIGVFIKDWLDDKLYVEVKTSGSTGMPKTIQLKKQAMVKSALHTGNYFKLKPGDTALLCLPAHYIAGKMMLVRALILGLKIEIIPPKLKLNIPPNKLYAFCAMTPAQLKNGIDKISLFRIIIVGGAPVNTKLKEAIYPIQPLVYETYGMTETASHIAVKPILFKTKKEVFKTLPTIRVSQDDRNCLRIHAPYISETPIQTNDVVLLHSDTSFEWLGRFDNVINTAGVKVFPEQIEKHLESQISQRFFITSMPDEILGEAVTLVVETEQEVEVSFNGLSKFETPKQIITINHFKETPSGKIHRQNTITQII